MSWFKSLWHDQGEKDAAAGKYDGPGAFADDEKHRAYKDGWYHTRGQLDAGKNEYHSPHFAPALGVFSSEKVYEDKEADNEAYRAGWDSVDRSK